MAKYYGTCSHELIPEHYAALALGILRYDTWDCKPIRAIDYVIYCEACTTDTRKYARILETEQEQHDWLYTPMC
jgi:hypothetical protein